MAIVHGGQFVANHVPLMEGENTLTVKATDTEGNFYHLSTTVYGNIGADYIRLSAMPQSGLSPLETALRLEGSIAISTSSVSYAGPGTVEFPTGSVEEYTAQMTAEGIYYFTAEATDAENNIYTDTVAVQVLDRAELDALLKAKWNGMRTSLINDDITGAITHFYESSRGDYEEIFNTLSSDISEIASTMREIELIYSEGRITKYRIKKQEQVQGQNYDMTYYIYFIKDHNGMWRIESF